MRIARLLIAVVAVLALAGPAAAGSSLSISVLSNRADLISGGDALVQIVMPSRRLAPATGRRRRPRRQRRVRLARRRPLPRPRRGPRGRRERPHRQARRHGPDHDHEPPDRRPDLRRPAGAALVLHDAGRTGSGPATDAQCNAPTDVSLLLPLDASTGQFSDVRPGEPAARRRDDDDRPGRDRSVHRPRQERGTMDRGIYHIAVLADPRSRGGRGRRRRPGTTSSSTRFGASTAPYHKQSDAAPTCWTTTRCRAASWSRQLAHDPRQERERRTSPPRRDDAEGAHPRALRLDPLHDRPGLLGRLDRPAPDRAARTPACSTGSRRSAASPTRGRPRTRSPTAAADPLLGDDVAAARGPRGAASGRRPATRRRRAATRGMRSSLRPVDEPVADEHVTMRPPGRPGCTTPADESGRRALRPRDYQVAIWGSGRRACGPRREDRAASRSRPLDNVGIQYGLSALNAGLITPEQFVDLNEKVGGLDIDWTWQPQRMQADPGSLVTAYRTGARHRRQGSSQRRRSSTCAARATTRSIPTSTATSCARGSTRRTATTTTR